jgi:hypothetical protein
MRKISDKSDQTSNNRMRRNPKVNKIKMLIHPPHQTIKIQLQIPVAGYVQARWWEGALAAAEEHQALRDLAATMFWIYLSTTMWGKPNNLLTT